MNNQSTSRLVFKPLHEKDLGWMLTLTTNPDVVRYIPGMIGDAATMKMWFSSLDADSGEYVVFLRETGVPIGECSLTINRDKAEGEIGFMLLPEYWQQGYGTEVVQYLLGLAETQGVNTITAMTHTKNTAAVRLLLRTGFEKYTIGWMVTGPMGALEDHQVDGYIYEKRQAK